MRVARGLLACATMLTQARRPRWSLALAVAAVAMSTMGTRTAWAEPVAGADLHAGAFLSEAGSAPALGGAATVGYAIRGSRWFLVPEGRVGYLKVDDAYARNMLRFAGGARLGWLGRVSPSIHLHAGYGRAWGTDSDAILSRGGPTLEIGAAVDLALSRHVALGPRIGAGTMLASTGSGTEVTPWLVGGLQVVFSMGDSPAVPVPATARNP
jgi:hypothetical protein